VAVVVASEGGRVVLADINEASVRAIASNFPDALAIGGICQIPSRWDAIFRQKIRDCGVLDAVIHAAGMVDEAARAKRNASLTPTFPN